MLRASHISHSFGGENVLSDVSISVGRGQKVAVVGPNGGGKSTLLKVIIGQIVPESGTVEILSDTQLGYLAQEFSVQVSEYTVETYLKATVGLAAVEARLAQIENHLERPEFAEEFDQLQEAYLRLEGFDFESRMAKVLAGLGFAADVSTRSISTLSGGQRTKVALAGVLLQGSDLLILDEPTNNLDLPSTLWLERFLARTKAACIIVSHDRRFLDAIVSKVYEVEWYGRKLVEYTGTYSEYIVRKMQRIHNELALYEQRQQEVARLHKSADAKRQWGIEGSRQVTKDHDKATRGARRDRSAKAMRRAGAIDQQANSVEIITPTREREPTIIPLQPKSGYGRGFVQFRNVVAGYDTGFQVGPFSFSLDFGQRMGLVGRNATGKSTLLKALTGELQPLCGEITISSGAVVGNLMQHNENLPHGQLLIDFLRESTGCDLTMIYQILAQFNFTGAASKKLIGELSPGERMRAVLALFSLNSANLLILDEPTNHLDVDALDALETVLKTYGGSVVFVSHDRYFLEGVHANQLYSVEDGTVKEVTDYQIYLSNMVAEVERL